MSGENPTPRAFRGVAPPPQDPNVLAAIASGDLFRRSFPPRADLVRGMYKHQPNLELNLASLVRAMKSIEIRPTTLIENLRANLFPEKIESVVSTFKGKLLDLTLDQVTEMEDRRRERERVRPGTEKSMITHIEPVNPSDSVIPWGTMHTQAELIGAERWTVARVDPAMSPVNLAEEVTVVGPQRAYEAALAYPTFHYPSESSSSPASAPGAAPDAAAAHGPVLPGDDRATMAAKVSTLPRAPVPARSVTQYRVNYYTSMGGDFFLQ